MKEEFFKQFSIDDIEEFRDDEDIDFAIARIKFISTGNTYYNNSISDEVLKRDAKTAIGKLIIAKYNTWTKDVTTHVPNQSIVGYVTDVEIEKDELDETKLWAVATAKISKIYATQVYNLFKEKNFRNVSMEFSCATERPEEDPRAVQEEENPITAFHVHGITILGLSYNPACRGAEMTIKQFAESINISPLKQFVRSRKNKGSDDEMKGTKDFSIEGNPVDTTKEFAIDIGSLWCTVYGLLETKYPDSDYGSIYRIDGIYEEDGSKFAIIHKKDETKQYKLDLTVSEDGVKLGEDCVEVEQVFVEKDTVKKFDEPKDVDLSQYKIFAEPENDDDEKSEEGKEKDEDKGNDEGEKDKEGEKTLSTDVNLDQAAYLALIEQETEEYRTLATELWEAKDYNMVMSKVLSISKELSACQKELAELKEYKTSQDNKAKELVVEKQLSKVKDDLTPDQIKKFKDDAENYSIDDISIWENSVKAFAYDNQKPNSNKTGVTQIGQNLKEFEKPSTVNAEDVFKKYL